MSRPDPPLVGSASSTPPYLKGVTPEGLAYRVRGQGQPLLLLAGYATPARALGPLAAAFAEHFACITFDYRGTGRSRQRLGQVTTGGMARDAVRVLRHLQVDRAHVYGVSLGGMVAQELALHRPEMVHGLVLGATTPGGWRAVPAGPWTIMSAYDQARGSVPGGLASRGVAAILHAWAASTHDTSTRLGRIAAPTLVVHGDQDVLVPPRNARLLASGIPGAELMLRSGQGHLYLFDDHEASAEAVTAWLERLPAASVGPGETNGLRASRCEAVRRHALSQLLPVRHATRSLCPVSRELGIDG